MYMYQVLIINVGYCWWHTGYVTSQYVFPNGVNPLGDSLTEPLLECYVCMCEVVDTEKAYTAII